MKPEQYSASCAAFIPPDCGDSNDDSNRSGQWQASAIGSSALSPPPGPARRTLIPACHSLSVLGPHPCDFAVAY
jgi:hypothetical protein